MLALVAGLVIGFSFSNSITGIAISKVSKTSSVEDTSSTASVVALSTNINSFLEKEFAELNSNIPPTCIVEQVWQRLGSEACDKTGHEICQMLHPGENVYCDGKLQYWYYLYLNSTDGCCGGYANIPQCQPPQASSVQWQEIFTDTDYINNQEKCNDVYECAFGIGPELSCGTLQYNTTLPYYDVLRVYFGNLQGFAEPLVGDQIVLHDRTYVCCITK